MEMLEVYVLGIVFLLGGLIALVWVVSDQILDELKEANRLFERRHFGSK